MKGWTPGWADRPDWRQARSLQQLVNVHDFLRTELTELREILANVREGALDATDVRSELGEMALRQNDWDPGRHRLLDRRAALTPLLRGARDRRTAPGFLYGPGLMRLAQASSIRKTGVRGVSACASSNVPVAFSRPR